MKSPEPTDAPALPSPFVLQGYLYFGLGDHGDTTAHLDDGTDAGKNADLAELIEARIADPARGFAGHVRITVEPLSRGVAPPAQPADAPPSPAFLAELRARLDKYVSDGSQDLEEIGALLHYLSHQAGETTRPA